MLERVNDDSPGGFRAFVFGVVRNVAFRFERRAARRRDRPSDSSFDPDRLAGDSPGLSAVFDRAWAESLLAQASERLAARAHEKSEAAVRRVELLRLRFGEGMPIRDIARRWDLPPARVHKDYAKAREEFRRALYEVVAFHLPGSEGAVRREASRLLGLFD